MKANDSYPKPKQAGGHLIRAVVRSLKDLNLKNPINAHILIACSGGVDSLALALLLLKYGKRVVHSKQISLLHINHGWRGEESDKDEDFVREFAKSWEVPFFSEQLDWNALKKSGSSPEEIARKARKLVFKKHVELLEKKHNMQSFVFTGHHMDDLFETLIWRFFTGSFLHQIEGMKVQTGVEIRPFLNCEKDLLKAFLKEENQEYRFDQTNDDPRFLRNEIRSKLVSNILDVFPGAKKRLLEYKNQSSVLPDVAKELFELDVDLRKNQIDQISKGKSVFLKSGWQLQAPKSNQHS